MKNPPIKIKLLGEFEVQGVTFSTQSAAKLVALLVLYPEGLSRKAIAAALWPESDVSVALGALRKALQRARADLPENLILVTDDHLALDPAGYESDYGELAKLRNQFLLVPFGEDSQKLLHQEIEALNHTLGEGWDGEWLEAARSRLLVELYEDGLRLLESLEADNNIQTATEVIEKLLPHFPTDYVLLARYARVAKRSFGASHALEVVNFALRKVDPSTQIPRPVKRLVQSLRSSEVESVADPELFTSRDELKLLGRLVEANLRSSGAELVALLAVESSKTELWDQPHTLLLILEKTLNETGVRTDDEIQVALNACVLSTYASHRGVGMRFAQSVMDAVPESDPRHIRALSFLGYLNFESQNFELAHLYLSRSLALCQQHLSVSDHPRFLNRMGVFLYHTCSFDEAYKVFHQALDLVDPSDPNDANFLYGSIRGNLATMHLLRGDMSESLAHGESVLALPGENVRVFHTYVRSSVGYAKLRSGDESGLRELVAAIRETARERLKRYNLVAIEHSAAWLSRTKPEVAQAMFSVSSRIRDGIGYPASPAEQAFVKSHCPSLVPVHAEMIGSVSLSKWAIDELEVD
ncbi:MAG TPA: hypothetical protein VK171_15605 [Fimbriimonas sp.]|nr:hypothetical protein [Fimbriimonas sp.]